VVEGRRRQLTATTPAILVAAILAAVAPALAQSDSGELAKKLQNPIADLISVPLQSNWDFGIGRADAMRYTLNVQPVIPFHLSRDWNLITRTIVPFIHAESPTKLGDLRHPRESRLVVRRRRQAPGRQQHVHAAVPLVHDEDLHDIRREHGVHVRLGEQPVDGAAERDGEPAPEDRDAADQPAARRPVLRRAADRRAGLGIALHDYVPVSTVTRTEIA